MSYTKPGEVLGRAALERQRPIQIREQIEGLEQRAVGLYRELLRIYPQGAPPHIEREYREVAEGLRRKAQALRSSN